MTTAPARPTLYGPDGQALTTPRTTGDWAPVQINGNATVWEKSRTAEAPNVVKLDRLDQTTAAQQEADALRAEAARTLDGARAEADRIRAGARTEAEQTVAEARSLRTRTLSAATHEANVIREQAEAEAARREENGKRLDVWMARAVIAGAVGLTATGEYSLARLAHFPKEVAWLLPFVIDVYVIQAFRRHRDIVQAIGLTIAANVVYHLAAAGMFGVTVTAGGGRLAKWWLIAMVASIASVILWRMHVMTEEPRERRRFRRRAGTAPVPGPPAPSGTGPTPALEDAPVPAPQPVPEAPSVPASVPPSSPVPAPCVGAVPDRYGDPVLMASPVPVPEQSDQQERTPVPPQVPAAGTAPVPPAGTDSVPARKPVPKHRSTGARAQKRTARRTAPKTGTGTGTASFDEHVDTVRDWLANDPNLSGTDIGKRLGTGDSYGRRVKRAASGSK